MKVVRLIALIVLVTSISVVSLVYAQVPPDPGGGGPGSPPNGNPTDTPITGIEILIALGSILGAKKIFDVRKKK